MATFVKMRLSPGLDDHFQRMERIVEAKRSLSTKAHKAIHEGTQPKWQEGPTTQNQHRKKDRHKGAREVRPKSKTENTQHGGTWPTWQDGPTTHHQHKKKDRSTKQERQGQSGRQTRRREGKDKEEGIPRGREE